MVTDPRAAAIWYNILQDFYHDNPPGIVISLVATCRVDTHPCIFNEERGLSESEGQMINPDMEKELQNTGPLYESACEWWIPLAKGQ